MKIVSISQNLEPQFDKLHSQGTAAFESGLLIGVRVTSTNNGNDTDVLVSAIKTPESGESGKQLLDSNWFASHAQQVSKMLPAGLDILGVYLYAPEVKGLDIMAENVLIATASMLASEDFDSSSGSRNFLVLQRKSLSSGLSCHECNVYLNPKNVSKPAPTEFKFVKNVEGQISRIQCTVPVNLQLFSQDTGLDKAEDVLAHEQIANMEKFLQSSCAKIQSCRVVLAKNGRVVDDHQFVKFGNQELDLELMPVGSFPLVGCAGQEKSGTAKVSSCVSLRAKLRCLAYVHEKDTFSRVKQLLLRDATKSLRIRFQMTKDELGIEDEDEFDSDYLTTVVFEQNKLQLPRRVCFKYMEQLAFCEYLSTDDMDEVAIETWKDILGETVTDDQMFKLEEEASFLAH